MADLQQRTPAWHIARRGKLTASNLGAALGQVSYTSRQVAYKRALGLDKFQGNEACQWGNDNEMNGIAAYQAKGIPPLRPPVAWLRPYPGPPTANARYQ